MASVHNKRTGRQRRHWRVRKHVSGAPDRPRLCVFRSLRYIYAQVIDDEDGRTIVAADSREPGLLSNGASRRSTAAARTVGKTIGERAKAAGISKVVFDRGGYLYHGRVRGLAEGAREAGLEF